MLSPDRDRLFRIREHDRSFYSSLLPKEHPLLNALELIPWDSFVPELESFYCPDRGQPAVSPLVMFKLEFLRYFCRLSDREVILRAQTDVLFRWFLQIPVVYRLPDASLLPKFRGRLGAAGFKKLFERLISYARDANLIRDRLRLKDATHVIANIAVPTTLALLAQLREKMLGVIHSIDPEAEHGFAMEVDRIRQETEQASDEIKLQTRLSLVSDILGWIQLQTPPANDDDRRWVKLQAVRQLAEKITDDVLNPGKGHRTLSVVDPDARRGKHGEFYDGYLLDVMIDADSELITTFDVLPADADEAANAIDLVKTEQQTYGNKIEQLSMDAIGFNGHVLQELQDPEGPNVKVFTPPRDFRRGEGFPASMFELSEDNTSVTCPNGETSKYRGEGKHLNTFRFQRSQCQSCPLLSQCQPNFGPQSKLGKSVSKSLYEAEYEQARERAKTEEYAEVRRQHPAIERKLNELARHGRGRRARYWGQARLYIQQCMTCLVVNVKRISRLLQATPCPVTC
jgi:transposase